VIAPAAMQFAETEVAVGDKRTHAAGLGERQRLAIVAFGVLGTARGSDFSVQGESLGLIPRIPSWRVRAKTSWA
jgi:hypothetical protein